MPSSPQNGQTAFLGLGLVPSTKNALEDYTKFVNSADPKDPAVQAQSIQLSSRVLEGDLSAMPALKKNEKILPEDVEGELHIRPLPPSPLKKSAGVADLRRIVSKDDLRPALTGVFLDVRNKVMVATNGHMMAIIPDWTLTGNNRIIKITTKAEIDERYPDYQNVVPVGRQLVAPVNDLAALRARLNGLVQASKLVSDSEDPIIRAEIRYASNYYYFNPQFLLDVVTVLQVTGSTALKLEFDDVPNRALVLRDALDPKKVGIVMPVMNNLGHAGLKRTTTWPHCTVLEFTGDELPAPAPKPAKASKPAATSVPALFAVGSFAKVRPLPAGANTVYPEQKKRAGHIGKVVAVEAERISLDFNGEVVTDWSNWQLEVVSEAVARKAKSKVLYYQPTKELLESIGFVPWVDSEEKTWFQYAHSINGPWVRVGLSTKDATVRIESVADDAYQTVYCDSVLRNEQEFQKKLALVPYKKFPQYEAGDAVSLNYGGIEVRGQIQPYTGGTTARIKKGIAEVYVASLNRDLDLPVAQLTLVHRFKDQSAHQDMLPSGRSKPAAAPKVAKPVKAAKLAANPNIPKETVAKAKKAVASVMAMKKKEELPEIEYFNGNSKLVKGRVDAEKLYYVQPDGSYVQGGDRRSPGHVKAPKVKAEKPVKAPRAKKEKPVDTRVEVPQLSGEVLLMQAFLKIEGKPATIEQIRALHRRMEKDFTKHKVRSTSKHADVLRGIAGTVASLYAKMTDKNIGTIAKLEFKSADTKQLADKAKAIVGGVRVGTATTLLSAFVNMQGTVPTEKAVANLRTKLENEFEENPTGDFALAVGAAAAVLKDWRAGKPVRITKQQLSGLAGLMDLGCPDTPTGKGCGCNGSTPKKARR